MLYVEKNTIVNMKVNRRVEDIKELIIIPQSKKDRQHNNLKKKEEQYSTKHYTKN
jgi:hypothetical protein